MPKQKQQKKLEILTMFLIVWLIEGAYLRYLKFILFSIAFFIEVCIMSTSCFDIDILSYFIQLKDSSLLLIIMS